MAEGFTSDLMFESALVAIAALLLALQDLPALLAIPVTLLRVGIVTVFFAEYFDGSWCMNDDRNYFNEAITLLNQGYNPITAFLTSDGYDALGSAAGGHHFLYFWVNMSAMYFFGEHYYAAILVNVLFTFISGYLLVRIAQLLGFSRNYRIGLEVLYLLHWDVITWCSFVNLKESLVQMLTVAEFYFVVRFIQRRDWTSVVGFVLVLQTFYWIRFYLPMLILAATVLWALWQWQDNRRYLLVPIAAAATAFALKGAGRRDRNGERVRLGLRDVRDSAGTAPLALIDDVYYFMLPSAALHLLFLCRGRSARGNCGRSAAPGDCS